MRYSIKLSPRARRLLDSLPGWKRPRVEDAIKERLSTQPNVANQNRKPLRPDPATPTTLPYWELKLGNERVMYQIEEGVGRVRVEAIGTKEGNRFLFGVEIVDSDDLIRWLESE